jgi:PAS domain S-box-containing protein
MFDAAPIYDADGNVSAVVETLQDITESKLTEEKLHLAAQKELDSTQQIKSLFNNVFDGLMVLDEQGLIENANQAVKQIFDYKPEALIGQPFNILLSNQKGRFDTYLADYTAATVTNSAGVSFETTGLRRNGSIFGMDLVINEAIMSGKRKFICTARDVSERRYMEKLYRLMSENIEGYASIILDPQGNIKTWNAGAETLKGYTAEDIIGKSFKTFYTEESIEKNTPDSLLATCMKDGHVHDEGWRVRKDGSQFYAEVVINKLQEDDGSLLGFVKVTRDMTARKHLDNELKQAYDNLEEFTSVASHDLRSPLRGIADLVDWIKEDLGDDIIADVKKNLDRVELRVKRMETLIEDLLQYSRAGRASAEVTLVSPITLVNEVLEIQPVPADFDITVSGNARAFQTPKTPLQTSVRNLISNAIKHHDQAVGNIDITVKTVGSYCVFTIADDGPGIPTAAKDRVFKLFQTLSSNKESSGIGLAVTKRMVEAHGGYIELDTTDGKRGTTFQIWWPRFQTVVKQT